MDDNQNISQLQYAIPPKPSPFQTLKNFQHFICQQKLIHYYIYYTFNDTTAHKLVLIRKRFKNGNHMKDVKEHQQYCRVYGGNQLSKYQKLISKVSKNNQSIRHLTLISNANEEQKSNIEISFTNLDSLSAAIVEYHAINDSDSRFNECTIAILDLASRRHVGGLGYCFYAGTQEEDLIRCSSLYYLLHPRMNDDLQIELNEAEVYDSHIPYFGCTYIPNVTFLSGVNDEFDERMKLRNEELLNDYHICKNVEYTFNVVCSAAIDLRCTSNEYRKYFYKVSNHEIRNVLKQKIEAQIASAILSENDIFILGAFGCGVYKCDTRMVAECYYDVLRSGRYRNKGLKKVVFAIAYDEQKLNDFRSVFQQ